MNTSLIPQGLSGFDAFQQVIKGLQPKGEDGNCQLWLKHGNDRVYVGNFNPSGRFKLYETKGKGKDRRRTRLVGDAFNFLNEKSRTEPGGVFYIPTPPIGFPLAGCVVETDNIAVECDTISTEQQWLNSEDFQAVTGLTFHSRLTTGGKSIHLHLKAFKHLPLEQANYLRRLAVIAFLSDPVTEHLHQPMRLPGFWRQEKEAEQRLLSWSSDRYSYEALVEGFRHWFAHKGWAFPESIPDVWWVEILKPIFPAHKGRGEAEKAALVKQALETGFNGYQQAKELEEQARQQRREARKLHLLAAGRAEDTSLSELVKQTCDRLGKDGFELYNHDWQQEGSKNHARGRCYWHESTSGNSAFISEGHGWWGFVCPACTNAKRIDAFTYWRYATYGKGASTPHGKDYVDQAKAFLASHGVTAPAWQPQQSKLSNVIELPTQRRQKPIAVYTAEFEGG